MLPGFRHYIDTVKNDYLDLLVFDPSAQEIFYTSFIYSHRPYNCSNYQTMLYSRLIESSRYVKRPLVREDLNVLQISVTGG